MFNEQNTAEALIVDAMIKSGWKLVEGPQILRDVSDVLNEEDLRTALSRLNPDLREDSSRVDEVVHRLRGVIIGVQGDGLVTANEKFTNWIRGEESMPFGHNGMHVPIRLIDFENISNNDFVVARQVTFTAGQTKRFDVVGFVNGLPLLVGEAKSPVRPAVSWVDGASQVHNDYEKNVGRYFVPNTFSFATDGKDFRYGTVGSPLTEWLPWRLQEEETSGLGEVARAALSMLKPEVVLSITQHFTLFSSNRKRQRIKMMCRYQQFLAVNQIIDRVVDGHVKKGLIWHFQGSGKSLLMAFASNRLRSHPALGNPTVVIVVDRVDLDTQITATFTAADIPNLVPANSSRELQELLMQDSRKVIITTIHKFGDATGVLNTRENIVVLVDEAHRTQEGDLGRKMRDALPNAFLFGLTGTPINTRDRNTFFAFGATEDPNGYLNRYSFEESVRDEATLPLHFESRLVNLHIDRASLDAGFEEIAEGLGEEDRAEITRRAGKFAYLVKSPARVNAVIQDIAEHFVTRVQPNGFAAQIVTIDQETCLLYKNALDKILPSDISDVVINVGSGTTDERRRFARSKDEEARLLDRFRDPADPLKILIVTARLLTGFDAPNLQCMYLDKPLREHNLLQAICRTNRPSPGKSHGLIVDYLGIFDDVAQALNFDEQSMKKVVSNLETLKAEIQPAVIRCLSYFTGIDRSRIDWESLLAAQQMVPTDQERDAFALDFHQLALIWDALSPDPILTPFESDYRWLAQVYESLKPPSGNGKLLWHALGSKTIELIHRNVRVIEIQDDIEIVLSPEVVAELEKDPDRGSAAVEFKLSARLRSHSSDPEFVALSERLEQLRQKHQDGVLASVEFLRSLIELARDIVEKERNTPIEVVQGRGRAALTDLFNEIKDKKTPIIVERVVSDIDDIVQKVRFENWQKTEAGEREVKQALRRTLLKYKLHNEQNIFDRAYEYIFQYY